MIRQIRSSIGWVLLSVIMLLLIGCTAYVGYVDKSNYHLHSEPRTQVEKSPGGLRTFDRFYKQELTDAVEQSVSTGNESSGECGPFILPDFKETPPLPDIPPEKRNDDGFIANELIDYVQLLISHQRDVRDDIIRSYEEYIETCSQ